MHDSINLPPVYELISLERGSALEEAVRLAVEGADEGTLVWRRAPLASNGITDLDCALILRLDHGLDIAAQLIYVAAVSLSSALGEAVQSMVGLRFLWPNRVRIGLENTAFLELRWPSGLPVGETDNVEWLVLGVRLEGALGAVADNSSFPDLCPTAADILQRFGRHFLADINRWVEEDFQQTRRRWLSRADGVDEPMRVTLGDNPMEGIFESIDDQGRLVLRLRDGSRQRVSVVDFFHAQR